MNLKEINLKKVYRSGDDDILNDFYLPALKSSNRYDRAVGFFSTSILMYALAGISKLIQNDGEMRLVIGYPLDDEEFEVLKDCELVTHLAHKLQDDLKALISASITDILKYRLKLFYLMVATGRLKIKFAFRRKGMYHEKIGIMRDSDGNRILFQGSANETTNAINPDLNFESISVYPSWEAEVYEGWAKPYEEGFERLWSGTEKNVVTLDIPSSLYSVIHKKAENNNLGVPLSELLEDEALLVSASAEYRDNGYPSIPRYIHGTEFEALPHQTKALRSWADNNYKGILKLATGAGKTITAMIAVSKIFEANRNKKLALIVAVPYIALAEQWVKELKIFNMDPLACFGSKSNWEERLNSAISRLALGKIDFISVVVVNQTLRGDNFQRAIARLPRNEIFFVGDECHNHSSDIFSEVIPDSRYKIGLSATPYSEEIDAGYETDPVKIENLKKLYGRVVAEYSMANALGDGVLTPYKYHINLVSLSGEEMDKYSELSKEIAKLLSIDKDESSQRLKDLIRRRNRIISNASNKVREFVRLLDELNLDDKLHTLVYVGEGGVLENEGIDSDIAQLQVVAEAMRDNGWKVSRFTAKENKSERFSLLTDFKDGYIDALVSMKVLDEGIDIPACRRAFILASTTNSRQFIQRRGRILRKSPGKEMADIYDFVVIPTDAGRNEACFVNLVRRELYRVMEFVRLSRNRSEGESIAMNLAEDFGLDVMEL